jgi:hypothetical protein
MSAPNVHHLSLDAKWVKSANCEEIQEVADIDAKIARKTTTLAELRAKKHKIMRRCIKRAQRRKNQC